MLCISRKETDPYFNIAAEEYFLKEKTDEFFMLWCNKPSVIVGKHQNAMAEINHAYINEHQIPVIRRISGGGTVYHDDGNLNFTVIAKGDRKQLVNFRKFTQPIIDVLHQLDIAAEFGEKNDIRVGEKKISGNSEHVWRDKVLHHGTILVSSNLERLNESIRVKEEMYQDRAIKSNRSTVANINEFLQAPISLNRLQDKIMDYMLQTVDGATKYELNASDKKQIQLLARNKYTSWEWNFAYSPAYTYVRKFHYAGKDILLELKVEKGLIRSVDLVNMEKMYQNELNGMLYGIRHEQQTIRKLFSEKTNYEIPDKLVKLLLQNLF
jgi:lipoate-protein ligase A